MVGAWNDTTSASATGSAYVFARSGDTWTQRAKLIAKDAAQSDNLGGAIGLAGNTVFIGAQNTDAAGNNSGSTYVFEFAVSAWSNYGQGWPGTNGIPALSGSAAPRLGTTVTLSIDNSAGQSTAGILALGFTRSSSSTTYGGILNVGQLSVISVTVPPGGMTFPLPIPAHSVFCGLQVFAQAFQGDAGASHNLSFTPALELDLGF